ncbi:hypothetical protein C8Q78DRAFT_475500 [Trametes maxima]|nr:hypothetical protein C8Q78DRAFT_475500 [Trametes maxima]
MATEKSNIVYKKPSYLEDSDDVRSFMTMGGQVHWANVVYHTGVRDCDIDPQLRQITPPPEEHRTEYEDSTYERFWSEYMADVPQSPRAIPSPRVPVADRNEPGRRHDGMPGIYAGSESRAEVPMTVDRTENSRASGSSVTECLEVSSISEREASEKPAISPQVDQNVSVESTSARTQFVAHAPSRHSRETPNARENTPLPAALPPVRRNVLMTPSSSAQHRDTSWVAPVTSLPPRARSKGVVRRPGPPFSLEGAFSYLPSHFPERNVAPVRSTAVANVSTPHNPTDPCNRGPSGSPFPVSSKGKNVRSSPSYVKLEETEVDLWSPGQTIGAVGGRRRGKHTASPAHNERPKPYDRPQINLTAKGLRKKPRAGVTPQHPPKGFVTEWAERDANWVWDGKALPGSWAADTIWDRLNTLGVPATNTECRWKGCPMGGKKLVGLKRHIEGVHLECKYRCTGCGVHSPRYDMWKRTKHMLGCAVAPLHPENGYYKSELKAKMEEDEDDEINGEDGDDAESEDDAKGEQERAPVDVDDSAEVGSSTGDLSEDSEEYDQLDSDSDT